MANKGNRKKISWYYIMPSLIIVAVSCFIMYVMIRLIYSRLTDFSFDNNFGSFGDFFAGMTTPFLTLVTALFALWAFLSQKEQLNLQKEDSIRHHIEGTFFQLFALYNNMVDGLEYEISNGKEYNGRGFFKKAYIDLMNIYLKEEGPEEQRLKTSMEKLDAMHANNFHLYYKNLFQLFAWIYDNREALSKNQKRTYIDLIRAQLSHYEMMLVYFNAKFFGRNFFYKMLNDLHFFDTYNLDGYGTITAKFVAEAEAFNEKKDYQYDQKATNDFTTSLTRDELELALMEKQLTVEYQPIIRSFDQKVSDVEALLRWHHPKKGYIEPAIFIPQMEYYGFGDELLEYLICEVCEHMKKHRSKLVYSINLSIDQLLLSDLLPKIDMFEHQYKMNNNQIQFEITESKEIYHRPQVKYIIHELQFRGYRVGIDDFGSGYFSFMDFIGLPFDFIKMDKQFVNSLHVESINEKTVEHIIEMAMTQDKEVIIEGIETQEQFEVWERLGVHKFQGYYISKPVNGKDILKLNLKKLEQKLKNP
ncbi:EAL domain-containing protein [Virgibacillus ainsalahensis]